MDLSSIPSCLSDPAPELIFYNAHRCLLICLECRYCLDTVDMHIRKYHQQIPKAGRDAISAFYSTTPALGHTDKHVPLTWDTPTPVEYLDIHKDAYICPHEGCLYVCLELKTYNGHVGKAHRCTDRKAASRGHAQTLFHQPNIVYFQVHPTEVTVDTSEDIDALLERSLEQYEQAVIEQDASAAIAPLETPSTEVTPWLLRAQWPFFLAGVDMSSASSLLELPSHYKEERHPCALICQALDLLLTRAHLGTTPSQCPLLIRRMLASTTVEHCNTDPANFNVSRKTLGVYIRTWQSFILFIFRARHQSSCFKLQLTVNQHSSLDAIANATIVNDVNLDDLACLLLELSIDVITQPILDHAHEAPLVHVMGVLGFHPTSKTWRLPHLYTPYLSHLLYCARILALEHCIPASTRSERRQLVLHFKRFHAEHLVDNSLTAITELISLRSYGMVIAKEHYSQERFHWSQDHQTLYFDDVTINIPLLRSVVKDILLEAQDLLTTRLVFRSSAYLDSRDPRHFRDNINNTSNRWCFIQSPENKLQYGARRVSAWLQASPFRQQLFSGAGDNRRWAHSGIHAYHKTADKFLGLLFVLVHLTSGMPARGTEVASMKITNTISTPRNFYIHDGQVMTVTSYHKPQAITGAPMVISRWLPASVGQLYVSYAADVLPFSTMLRHIVKFAGQSDTALFTGYHGPWDSTDLTARLKACSTQYLGTPLSMAAWRQVAVALDKGFDLGFIDSTFSTEEHEDLDGGVNIASAYQTGHRPTIHHRLYGQSSHLTDGAMALTRAVSSRLHAFWSLQSRHNPRPSPPTPACSQPPVMDVEQAIRHIFPPSGAWRSAAQEEAVLQSQQAYLDNITVLPTGGGKSAIFMVLALMHPSSVQVVVIPYQALLRDMIARCLRVGIQAEEWTGGINGHKHIIFVSAEAAITPQFMRLLHRYQELGHLGRIFIDECHTLVLARHYREAMSGLSQLRRISQGLTLMTATLPKYVEAALRQSFGMLDSPVFRSSTARLSTKYCLVVDDHPLDRLLEQLLCIRQLPTTGKIIVFVGSLHTCEQLATSLDAPYFHSTYIDKLAALDRWSRGQAPLIVATSALGQGVDVPNVTHVFHYDHPYLTLSDFIQQSGRAGREGQPCTSMTLMSSTTRDRLLRPISPNVHPDELAAMRDYIQQACCRRIPLTQFFDEGGKKICAQLPSAIPCDLCSSPQIACPLTKPPVIPDRREPLPPITQGQHGLLVSPITPASRTPDIRPSYNTDHLAQAPLKRRRETQTYSAPPLHPSLRCAETGSISTSNGHTCSESPIEVKSSPLSPLGSTPSLPPGFPTTPLPILSASDPRVSIPNSTAPSDLSSPSPFITALELVSKKGQDGHQFIYPRAPPVEKTISRPKTPPYDHGEQTGQQSIRRMWDSLSTGCPPCWMTGNPTWREHRFSSCPDAGAYYEDTARVRSQMHFSSSVVHFACGAPIWFCYQFRQRDCKYQNITFPLVAAIFRSAKFQPLLSTLATNDFVGYTDTTAYSLWLTRNTHRFGRAVPNAISLIEQVFLAIEGPPGDC